MCILILTRSSDDACTQQVTLALEERGHTVVRFNTDLYPQDASLSTTYRRGGRRRMLGEVDLDKLDAVYFRRFAAATQLPKDLGELRAACHRESLQTLYGTIASLDCFQLDPFAAIAHADHKELQIKRALALGLDCPPTLFSNDPVAVRAFSHEVGEVVAKLQSKVVVHRHGEQQAVFTSLLSEDDLADMDGLRYSPMMFQAKIEKFRELRVTVVGEQIFPAAIDTTVSRVGQIDWRLDNDLSYGWEPWELPDSVRDSLRRLVHSFGLNYAAADFILTPDGRYVFLEINAMGEWMWLYRDMDLRVDRALARTLTDANARLTQFTSC
jgi:glutathione synthase/RimK-type ligase-like ATP-grasp enzyme